MKKVTIIVPVYADWSSLQNCIESLKTHVDQLHTIILVNDNGPEADQLENNITNSVQDHPNFKYHRNNKNLGFVQNCNNAVFNLDKSKNDILLLNSDTEVTTGFLNEMIDVLYDSEEVAVVTPRSNNATLATIPLHSAPQKGIKPKQSYKIFQAIKSLLPRYNEVPTAHGFCMLIKRIIITKYGLFDEIFGKGYGEEVDFCQRIHKKGYKSVLSNRAYVFHLEARSFTHDVKAKLLEQNNKIIWERYPYYRENVRAYMREATERETSIEKSLGIKNPITIRLKHKVNNTWHRVPNKLLRRIKK